MTLLGLVVAPSVAPSAVRGQERTPLATPAGEAQGFQGAADVLGDLDRFWSTAFSDAGQDYASPEIVIFDAAIETGCGPAEPAARAFYCPPDQAIFFADAFFAEQETRFGDYAWINVFAHEWGHHVQTLLLVTREPGNAFELQADCLAGAYAQDAAARELLEPGDVTEAVLTSAAAGDDPLWPQDQPGAHGTNDDRISAFMRGYLDGLTGCALPIASAPDPGDVIQNPRPAPAGGESLAASLPSETALPAGLILVDEGGRGVEAIAASFPDPAGAGERLAAWRFRENAFRTFATPDGSLSVQISLHRFASAEGAAAALPFYADGREVILGLRRVPGLAIGDQAATVVGGVSGGEETTVYVRRGVVLARVSVVATADDPRPIAEEAAAATLAALDGRGGAAPALRGVLPTEAKLILGWTVVEEGARGEGAIAASFPAPAEAATLLATWGWEENVYRNYAGPDRISTAEVSLHRFATASGAAEALPYYADGRSIALGLAPMPLAPLGDQSTAVGGGVAGGRETTVYARRGALLVRVSVVLAAGDPTAEAIALATVVLARSG